MRLVAVIAVVLAALAIGVGVWIAGEWHYDNCVDAAEATHPITTVREEPPGADNPFIPSSGPTTRVLGVTNRREAIEACSRWPL